MSRPDEDFYRKFIGLCQLSSQHPLVVSCGDEFITINLDGKERLKIDKDDFREFSVPVILEMADIEPLEPN